jgi:hypothetical protein
LYFLLLAHLHYWGRQHNQPPTGLEASSINALGTLPNSRLDLLCYPVDPEQLSQDPKHSQRQPLLWLLHSQNASCTAQQGALCLNGHRCKTHPARSNTHDAVRAPFCKA